ncbi:MAG TPA: hypothetical protein VI076_15015 [Actinopolymorphaceae bacterium]
MAPDVVHRTLDGTRFRLAGGLDLGQPATSTAELTVHGRLHEFTAGVRTLAEDVARALGIARFDDELDYRGGRFLAATRKTYDAQTRMVENLLIAAWQGELGSLVTRLYDATAADALALFHALALGETTEGVTLAPDETAGARFARPATLTKQVPGIGLLELTVPTREHTSRLPSWQGVTVPAGELFRDTLSDGSPYFVLAGRDTWASLVPLADTDLTALPDVAGRLRIERL